MAGTYCVITKDDMIDFLNQLGFRELKLSEAVGELVYGRVVAPNITLRIYTSITHNRPHVRARGADAIRLLLIKRYRHSTGEVRIIPIMGKAKRVYRTQGWRDNLQRAITDLTRAALSGTVR